MRKGFDLKKRVLIVTSGGLDRSGVPSVIMTIVRGLKNDCVFDIMLSAPEADDYLPEFKGYGGRVFPYVKRRFRLSLLNTLSDFLRPVSLYFGTRRVITANGPYDAVHCFNEFDMAGSLAAAAVRKVPIRVGHVNKTWGNRGGPLTRLYRRYCRCLINRYATDRLGCSRLACDCFYAPGARTRIINNPYDEQRFYWDPDAAVTGGGLHMVQVGYLCDNKNQRFTLEVFRSVAEKIPEAKLTFVGADSAYGKALKKDVCAKGLEDCVTFLPSDTDIPGLLNSCSLLMLPSRAEGFGIVLIEAQAMGLFCYASDTVPKETDLGGVRFLPLSSGPGKWAEAILKDHFYEKKIPRDCSAFSVAGFTADIRRVYKIDGSYSDLNSKRGD